MKRILLKAKIHRATITQADLDYEGSLVLDGNLMRAADMIPYEKVHIYNISNGERFSTYLIKGEENSGIIGVLGAAAHKAKVGDKVIIASYVWLDEDETDFFMPKILIMDDDNRVKEIK